jgi:hypothetical protein
MSSTIATYSGLLVDPFAVTHRDGLLRVEDVAHALSQICRYNGQCSRFYSVAEHCLLVEQVVSSYTDDVDARRWALVHDAAEAYLCDLPAPIKRRSEFAFYREAEKRLGGEIALWLGLYPEEPELVTHAILGFGVRSRGHLRRRYFRSVRPQLLELPQPTGLRLLRRHGAAHDAEDRRWHVPLRHLTEQAVLLRPADDRVCVARSV